MLDQAACILLHGKRGRDVFLLLSAQEQRVPPMDADRSIEFFETQFSRQVSQGANWVDAPVQAATVQKLEDIILTKARDLRRSAIGG